MQASIGRRLIVIALTGFAVAGAACVPPPPPTEEEFCLKASYRVWDAVTLFWYDHGEYPTSDLDLVPAYLPPTAIAPDPLARVGVVYGATGDDFPLFFWWGDFGCDWRTGLAIPPQRPTQ